MHNKETNIIQFFNHRSVKLKNSCNWSTKGNEKLIVHQAWIVKYIMNSLLKERHAQQGINISLLYKYCRSKTRADGVVATYYLLPGVICRDGYLALERALWVYLLRGAGGAMVAMWTAARTKRKRFSRRPTYCTCRVYI